MNKNSAVTPAAQTQSRSSLIAHKEPYSSREGSIDYSLDDLPDDIRDFNTHKDDSSSSDSDEKDDTEVFSSQHKTAEVEVHQSADLPTDQPEPLMQSHDFPSDQSQSLAVSVDLPTDQSEPVRANLMCAQLMCPHLTVWSHSINHTLLAVRLV